MVHICLGEYVMYVFRASYLLRSPYMGLEPENPRRQWGNPYLYHTAPNTHYTPPRHTEGLGLAAWPECVRYPSPDVALYP